MRLQLDLSRWPGKRNDEEEGSEDDNIESHFMTLINENNNRSDTLSERLNLSSGTLFLQKVSAERACETNRRETTRVACIIAISVQNFLSYLLFIPNRILVLSTDYFEHEQLFVVSHREQSEKRAIENCKSFNPEFSEKFLIV